MKEKQISRRSLLYGSVVALSILGIAYAAGSPKLEELIAENKRRAKALEFCIQNECTDKVYNENLEAKAKIREEILKHQAFSDYRKEKQRLREKDAEPTKSLSELYSLIKTYGFNVFERKEHAEKLESVYLRGYSYTWAEENLQKKAAQLEVALEKFKEVEKSFAVVYIKLGMKVEEGKNQIRKLFLKLPLKGKIEKTVQDLVGLFPEKQRNYLDSLERAQRNVIITSGELRLFLERTYDGMIAKAIEVKGG